MSNNDIRTSGPAIIIVLDDDNRVESDEVAQFLGHLTLPGVRGVEIVPPHWTIEAYDVIGFFSAENAASAA